MSYLLTSYPQNMDHDQTQSQQNKAYIPSTEGTIRHMAMGNGVKKQFQTVIPNFKLLQLPSSFLEHMADITN